LAEEVLGIIQGTEHVVCIPLDSRLLKSIGQPPDFPALLVWSGKGALIGYREKDESLNSFASDVRRFA
jgi:hypothetical protein